MRDLLVEPLWRPRDLGCPIPDSPHAVSVCLPTWQDVVDYEEGKPRVVEAMRSGYPRFFPMPSTRAAMERVLAEHGKEGEGCLLFPATAAAERCVTFIGGEGRMVEVGGLTAVFFPETKREAAQMYRRHSGDMISSRQAEAFLSGKSTEWIHPPEHRILDRLQQWTGQPAANHFLYANGMSAYFHLHRALIGLVSGNRVVQFGFPYVDVLKIQQKFPPGVEFIESMGLAGVDQLRARLERGGICAVFTEVPSNPLLQTPNLQKLHEVCGLAGVPLVVDDTIGGFYNVEALRWADASWSSLTKSFSGASDVMGGVVVVGENGVFSDRLLDALSREGGTGLFPADLDVLERNSRDYAERMPKINRTTNQLVDWLSDRPEVARVFYPGRNDEDDYRQVLRKNGGFGGLFSLGLHRPVESAPVFYDALSVSKGPSLGTNFTLACPYTLLAHWHELDWAESCGVSRWLIRVSVGLEGFADLKQRFEKAFDAIPTP